MLDLARQGRVLLPLRPPHSLMVFYTLSGNLGRPAIEEAGDHVSPDVGSRVFEMMREIAALVDPACLGMDPIDVLEEMARSGSRIACAPLIYGYVSYAMAGFRANRLAFADIPATGDAGPVGSALGGTGIAVSAFSKAKRAAIDFAYWIASGEVQRGPYALAGGQPGHAAAWDDAGVNAAAGNFYKNTRATLEGAWVRPRHDGYMAFQQAASDRINLGLAEKHDAGRVVADLNRLFLESFPARVSGVAGGGA
jgi:multiple sugar transport system substrate-binding protein